MKKKITKNKAFTLIEILVVATIIGVLVTVTAVSFANSQKNSRDARRQADLETVRQALVLYRQDNGSYGNVLSTLSSTTFTNILGFLSPDYLTSTNIADPKTANPAYRAQCVDGIAPNCNKVLLQAYLEKTGTWIDVQTP